MSRAADGPTPVTDPRWTLERLNAPSRLWGANGITFGPDGRLYVAQYLGGMISALDPHNGDVEPVVPPGGLVQSPDDLAFGADGSLYIADLVPGRVWRRQPAGRFDLVSDEVPVVNGITCVGDRLFVNEMRPGGRLLELFPDGGDPSVLTGGLALGNAMQRGPDGLLYYPHMVTGEVWRIALDGGAPELVATGLPQPVAVRFDLAGVLHVLSCGPRGLVTRLDLYGSGDRTVLDSGVPGLDNAAFDAENRMFVSGFADGGVLELHPDGRTREIVPPGLDGPWGITVDLGGRTYLADHYRLAGPPEDDAATSGPVTHTRLHFSHGVDAGADGLLHVTSQYGQVSTYDPDDDSVRVRARGLDRPAGVAARADGALVVAESGTGRVLVLRPEPPERSAGPDPAVLAAGLGRPADVVCEGPDRVWVTDEERGTLLLVTTAGEPPRVVADGLAAPQGLTVLDAEVFVVETGTARLLAIDPRTGDRRTVAENLPVGPGPAGARTPALTTHGMPGIPRPFAGLAATPDGALLLSAHREGTVLCLSRHGTTLPDDGTPCP
ncbi:hypothetical protein AB0J21_22915 [Streptomyces sp. NPDC049954]|uniref:hypothetical protein n=1 Tax=Streptomyces sp. NPDC049954 TaxID=3155779 RepID=UPI0034299646